MDNLHLECLQNAPHIEFSVDLGCREHLRPCSSISLVWCVVFALGSPNRNRKHQNGFASNFGIRIIEHKIKLDVDISQFSVCAHASKYSTSWKRLEVLLLICICAHIHAKQTNYYSTFNDAGKRSAFNTDVRCILLCIGVKAERMLVSEWALFYYWRWLWILVGFGARFDESRSHGSKNKRPNGQFLVNPFIFVGSRLKATYNWTKPKPSWIYIRSFGGEGALIDNEEHAFCLSSVLFYNLPLCWLNALAGSSQRTRSNSKRIKCDRVSLVKWQTPKESIPHATTEISYVVCELCK